MGESFGGRVRGEWEGSASFTAKLKVKRSHRARFNFRGNKRLGRVNPI
jgi:hypothetical protein